MNSSASNSNVSPTSQDEISLKAKVEGLEKQPVGPSSLGSSTPFESPNVTEIIAEGDKAVPFLVEALNQENKPVLVGYAAYCLRRIKTDKGKDSAIRVYKRFYKRRSRLTYEEPFAFDQLTLYLIEISAIPVGMEPPGLKGG